MKFIKFRASRIVFAFLLMATGLVPMASAATSTFKILLNTDNQFGTGCSVTTLTGTFQGVERILNTTVTTTGPVAQVTAVTYQSCTVAPTTFSAPAPITPPLGHPLPWTVGTNNGTAGTSVVETFIPQSVLPAGNPPVMRVAVLAFDGGNVLRDEMLTATAGPGNGPPILLNAQAAAATDVPTLSEWGLIFLGLLLAAAAVALLRRRTATAFLVALLLLGGAGLAWAAASDLNGNTTAEWTGGTLLATEAVSDAPVGTDMRAFYGQADPVLPGLSFRIDVQLFAAGNLPPTANNDTATVAEDAAATPINVLANDTDPENDPFTIASVTQPANGTVVITGGGTGLTYQPNANYCNTPPGTTLDVFTYTLNPGGATASVSVNVTCVDDSPTAVNDAATVSEGTSNNAIPVLANDTDPDAGPISITSVTQPANGTVVITGGGTGLTYTPNAGYCNTPPGTTLDTFTYTTTPGGSSATVTVTVNCVNDPPVAVDDTATLTEDDPATAINVLANDTDAEADPFTIASVTQPANGAVVITGGGTGLTYQPNANYCNTPPGTTLDTFTYTLTPGGSSATVTMTVTCQDDNPVAVADSATVAEDDPATAVAVLANDTDTDGGPISITSVTQPANGAVVITGGGTGLTYQPNANYCNTPPGTTLDTFTYTLTPGGSSTTVTMTVTCVDDDPTAVADAATVAEDSGANAIPVLANDTDPDGGPISITSVTQPANGAVVITGGGTGLTYQPNANYCNTPPGTTLDT
ncbi:MAG: IPTL-CTERM sorting domain-containing protein, partial [Thermoanaerobaculia bacterium]